MAAGSGSTDVIMINGGGDVAIEGTITIIHNHRMIIFRSLLHFYNGVLLVVLLLFCCVWYRYCSWVMVAAAAADYDER